jgi:methanogenic corrinoid protein MtbC1
MKDETQHRPPDASRLQGDEVDGVARKAIDVLASGTSERDPALELQLQRLCDAFLSPGDDQRHDAVLALRADGISGHDIIDHVIPATARLIGERWFADQISFADVTIATARLQEAVRSLSMVGQNGRRQPVTRADAPQILLVIPRPEHHTLGAFVAADQFRRLGYRVEIAIDQHPRQIVQSIRRQPFAMVGITASGRRSLASATEMVNMVRTTVTRVTPIVLGGTILDLGKDVYGAAGADHVARDVRSALRLCGLSLALRAPVTRELEGEAVVDRTTAMRVGR